MRYGGAKVTSHATKQVRVQLQDRSGEDFSLPTPESSSQVLGKDRDDEVDDLNHDEKIVGDEQQAEVVGGEMEDDSEGDDDLISPANKRRKMFDGSDTPVPTKTSPPPRRSSRLVSQSSPLRTFDDMATFPTPARSSPVPKRSTRLRQKQQQSSPPSRSTRSPSVQTLVSVEIPSPSPRRSSQLSELGTAETSDEDDKILATQAPRRRQSRVVKDPFVVNDDELQYISDDELPKVKTPRSRKSARDDFVVDDEDVEYITSDEDKAPRGKRSETPDKHASARKLKTTGRRRKREEQDELDDDLQNLQDSDNERSAPKTRTRGGPVTTKRDQAKEHLELLRRRRAGEKIPRVVDSDDDEETRDLDLGVIGYPDSDDGEGSVHSSIDTDIEEDQVQLREEDESDFVVEDSAGRHGRPNSAIPLQFTSFASAKPRELFIHIIEWLVKNKIAPAFSRQDELYELAFSRIDDQVKAQAGSRLISAAWGTEFKRAILARPEMKVSVMPGTDEENERNCDACNRTNHPARYEFVFSGQPYFKKTLEPLDHSDDEDDYSHDDVEHDEAGHPIPSASRRFYLGRFCAANADMGHKLTHWKYHLNANLLGYLEEQGVLSADAIVAREKLNKKKREREAENIVDSMQETGMIADLWADFENNLNDARLGMEDFDRRGGRSKGRIGAIRSTVDGIMREWDKDRFRLTRVPSESDSGGE